MDGHKHPMGKVEGEAMKTKWASSLITVLFLGVLNFSLPRAEAQSQGTQRMQERVTKEVYHELVMLPQLSIFDNLAYRIDSPGKVTLLGQVRNAVLKGEAEGVVNSQGDKDRASLRANGVPGVFEVQNNLKVNQSAK